MSNKHVLITQEKLPVDAGPDGHRHRQSRPVSAPSARPFESVVGTLHFWTEHYILHRPHLLALLYAREPPKNSIFRTSSVPTTDSNGWADGADTGRLWRWRCLSGPASTGSFSCV